MSLNVKNYGVLVYLTGGSTFKAPAGWNNLNNFIACVGAGTWGGGAYAQSNNVVLTPYTSYQINVGIGNIGQITDTYFGGTSVGSCIVGAQGGATDGSFNAGQAGASTGQIKFSGGAGAAFFSQVQFFGGGAAGPNGNGAAPVAPGGVGVGGTADGGTVPGGAAGAPGLSGTEFGNGFGCGSGAGGTGFAGGHTSPGGNYGGGGGGNVNLSVGNGGGGLIVIGYSPVNSPALLIGI